MVSFIHILLMMTSGVPAEPSAPETASPVAVVQGVLDSIRQFAIASDGSVLTKVHAEGNQEIVRRLHASLDLVGLEKSALGTFSDSISPKDRRVFAGLLRRTFAEIAYPQSAKFFGKFALRVVDRGLRKGTHRIEVLVEHPDEGEIELAFLLVNPSDRWLIRDLTLDGVSLRRDIEGQIRRTLQTEGFDGLVRRLRTKLDD